jgi:hypothetical protein
MVDQEYTRVVDAISGDNFVTPHAHGGSVDLLFVPPPMG